MDCLTYSTHHRPPAASAWGDAMTPDAYTACNRIGTLLRRSYPDLDMDPLPREDGTVEPAFSSFAAGYGLSLSPHEGAWHAWEYMGAGCLAVAPTLEALAVATLAALSLLHGN